MAKIGLDQNHHLRIETQMLEHVEWQCKVSWVDRVSELVLGKPLPGQPYAAVDPVVCNLRSLPVLVRVNHVPGQSARL